MRITHALLTGKEATCAIHTWAVRVAHRRMVDVVSPHRRAVSVKTFGPATYNLHGTV